MEARFYYQYLQLTNWIVYSHRCAEGLPALGEGGGTGGGCCAQNLCYASVPCVENRHQSPFPQHPQRAEICFVTRSLPRRDSNLISSELMHIPPPQRQGAVGKRGSLHPWRSSLRASSIPEWCSCPGDALLHQLPDGTYARMLCFTLCSTTTAPSANGCFLNIPFLADRKTTSCQDVPAPRAVTTVGPS